MYNQAKNKFHVLHHWRSDISPCKHRHIGKAQNMVWRWLYKYTCHVSTNVCTCNFFCIFLHALEASVMLSTMDWHPHARQHPIPVSHSEGLFFQLCALWPKITLRHCSKYMLLWTFLVGGHWSIVWFNLESKYFRQPFTHVWVHEASYMRTTKFSLILVLDTESFDTHKSLINVSVVSRNLPQVFHAVFFPFPRNWDTASQPTKAYQKSTVFHISSRKILV